MKILLSASTILLFSLCSVSGSLFECPKMPITLEKENETYTVPENDDFEKATLPKNYNCTYLFIVPKGYTMRISIASMMDDKDIAYFIDMTGQKFSINKFSPNGDIVAVWPAVSLHIETVTNSSRILFKYMFRDAIKTYPHIKKKSGEFIFLSDLNRNAVTFTSASNDKIAFTFAGVAEFYDNSNYNVYVYDGDNIYNSTVMGNLGDMLKKNWTSNGPSVTLVNYYSDSSAYLLVSNDVSSIAEYSKYWVVLATANTRYGGSTSDFSPHGSACTWICMGCTFSITQLNFDLPNSTLPSSVEIIPQTPTIGKSPLLIYPNQNSTSRNFPQHIPSDIFTMVFHRTSVAVLVETFTDTGYYNAIDGRKGWLFSPSIWNPDGSSGFQAMFDGGSLDFEFEVTMQSIGFAVPGEALHVTIGYHDRDPERNDIYTMDARPNVDRQETRGNFMQITNNGTDHESWSIIHFEIKRYNSAYNYGILSSIAIVIAALRLT